MKKAKIVLTADKTLMSDYGGCEFLGFAACAPTWIPERLYERIFCPPVPLEGVAAKFAPYGLRKIEAALIENGFSEDEVIVTRPDVLDKVIDEDTKVIGISTNDPLGLGPASSTFVDLAGKESFTALSFRRLLSNPLIRKYRLKVIVGGPGAWQLEDERIRTKMGIDCVLIGEGEITAPQIFKKAVEDEELPRFAYGEVVPLEAIPLIRGATINGIVEIARGCGRGCKFCNPTMLRYRCIPVERILKEVNLNINSGARSILLHAEDVLRYKAEGVKPKEEEVIKLFRAVKDAIGGRNIEIAISHFAISSVVAAPSLISSISHILEVGSGEFPWISGQTGIESGSERIIDRYMKGKAKPFKPEEWFDVVIEAHEILKENKWVPCSTLIMGLPGEEAGDVMRTIELVENLRSYKSFIVPLFFVPIGSLDKESFFSMKYFLSEHWMLLATCIKHNFRWIYKLEEEYFYKNGVEKWKAGAIKLLTRYAERKLRPYIADMERGKNPLS
ncbi:MAG: B12-binding domain-containing radical SAM protein [Candidatus Methanospirareceae archaeon]